MKLTELNPRWVGFANGLYNGVSFDCPHCKTQRLSVTFHPPVDLNGWWEKISKPNYEGVCVWIRDYGDTFDSLTLSPSVDTTISIEKHWHGFIKNGEVI